MWLLEFGFLSKISGSTGDAVADSRLGPGASAMVSVLSRVSDCKLCTRLGETEL